MQPVRLRESPCAVKEVGLGAIQGNALDSTNRKMADARMRLRDARFGQIVATQLTGQVRHLHCSRSSEPGSYIVEIMADDRSISPQANVLNVDGGQIRVSHRQAALPRSAAPSGGCWRHWPDRLPGLLATPGHCEQHVRR